MAPGTTNSSSIQTYVEYALAQVVTVDAIEKLKADGLVQPYPAVTPDLLRRIRNGMGDSHHCRLAHYQLLEDQGLLDFTD